MKPALTTERIERAMDTASKVFEVPRREIASKCRMPAVARARQAVYAALYRACETSYPDIARRIGRDHSTILYGIGRAEDMAHADPDYADRMRMIMAAALGVRSVP